MGPWKPSGVPEAAFVLVLLPPADPPDCWTEGGCPEDPLPGDPVGWVDDEWMGCTTGVPSADSRAA